MNHKSIARMLKIAGGVALAGILSIFYLFAPVQAICAAREIEGIWLCMAALMLLGLPYLLSIGCYFSVCGRIACNRSFCAENVHSMRQIARILILSTALWALAAAALILLPKDAAIFGALSIICGATPVFARTIALLAAAASLAVSMVAKMLSLLLGRATDLQADSDLTI